MNVRLHIILKLTACLIFSAVTNPLASISSHLSPAPVSPSHSQLLLVSNQIQNIILFAVGHVRTDCYYVKKMKLRHMKFSSHQYKKALMNSNFLKLNGICVDDRFQVRTVPMGFGFDFCEFILLWFSSLFFHFETLLSLLLDLHPINM